MGQSESQQGGVHANSTVCALLTYILFAVYLSWPHWCGWEWSQRALPVCWCIGASGTFLLSRRWVHSLIGAFFSGGLYSFGPLALYTTQFHEAGACIVAMIPWLLCPWAYSHLLVNRKKKWLAGGINGVLFALPFIFVAVLFRILSQYHLFVMPIRIGPLSKEEWFGLTVPLVMVRHGDLFSGLYHVGLGVVILGGVQAVRARRLGLALALMAASSVAIWEPWPGIFGVCPLIWWLFPQILLCIFVGLGNEFLLRGGQGDRAWVLGSAVWLVSLGVLMLLQSGKYFDFFLWFGFPYARLFVITGKLYLLGAVGLGLVYVLMKSGKRVLWFRASLVCLMLGADIFWCARYIVDRVLS